MQNKFADCRHGNARLITLVAILVVLAVIAAIGWSVRRPDTQPNLEEGQRISEDFLAQIRAGHPEQAWSATTAEFKSAMGREKLVKLAKDKPFLKKPLRFISVQTVTVNNQPRAEYLFRAEDGAHTVRLLAGKDQGAWRVDRIAIQ